MVNIVGILKYFLFYFSAQGCESMAIELKERGPTLYLYSLSETVYLTISQ